FALVAGEFGDRATALIGHRTGESPARRKNRKHTGRKRDCPAGGKRAARPADPCRWGCWAALRCHESPAHRVLLTTAERSLPGRRWNLLKRGRHPHRLAWRRESLPARQESDSSPPPRRRRTLHPELPMP